MEWLNAPSACEVQGSQIVVATRAKSDFWRKTHYGFIRDTGHFYSQPVKGDFTAEVKFTGQYHALYDQAGLMVRVDESNWIKCGIEFVDGVQQASSVVTRDFSDWAVIPLPQNPPSLWLRLTRQGMALEAWYSLDGERYNLLRLTYLPMPETASVGLMCASPDGPGFTVTFEGFTIR